MNKCIICNQEIKTDSQFINGNWYHNNCIELMAKQNKAYENMRKEAIDCINNFDWFDGKIPDDIEDVAFQYCMKEDVDELLNILNKVGSNDE